MEFPISTIRHSTAHLFAAAVQKLFPHARFGVGPDIENGFYYDISIPGYSLHGHDLEKITEEMIKLQKDQLPYKKIVLSMEDGIKLMIEKQQIYKVELLKLLQEKGTTMIPQDREILMDVGGDTPATKEVSFYQTGDFLDLCRGPHVENTSQTGVFYLNQITAAYWRGNAQNDSMQRVYGLCFNTQEELQQEIQRIIDAKERDHRILGAKHEIFFFEPELVGSGLPFWGPNGYVINKELMMLVTEYERPDKYQYVMTPIMAKEELYYQSGHLPFYKDSMYDPLIIEGQKYFLSPMNCPHHHLIYKKKIRSYRDLPIKLGENDFPLWRYESSGGLSGLERTRCFRQNDAHIYCTSSQAKSCIVEVLELHKKYYKLFNLQNEKDFYIRLSLPDMNDLAKYVDNTQQWLVALDILRNALTEANMSYKEVEGEAAFYGPKIDFQFFNAMGKEFTLSTCQLDFYAAERFGLVYHGADGSMYPVYVVHRAPLGSYERFTSFLIERYKARLPLWIAPVQVRVAYVSNKNKDYAEKVYDFLFNGEVLTATGGLRVEIDHSEEQLAKKIKCFQDDQIPYLVIVGKKEEESRTISVRTRDNNTFSTTVEELFKKLSTEIKCRL